jgi:leucyl-tRNA synthetase
VEQLVLANEEIQMRLQGLTLRKIIVVPDRIVNLVVA